MDKVIKTRLIIYKNFEGYSKFNEFRQCYPRPRYWESSFCRHTNRMDPVDVNFREVIRVLQFFGCYFGGPGEEEIRSRLYFMPQDGSVNKVAEDAGVTRQFLWKLRTGRKVKLSFKRYMALCEALKFKVQIIDNWAEKEKHL